MRQSDPTKLSDVLIELAQMRAERDALRESIQVWADETYDEGIAARMRDLLESTK
jgi:hypothetical protein